MRERLLLSSAAAVLCMALACAAPSSTTGGGKVDEGKSSSAPRLFPGRPDAQPKDQEKNLGQTATVGGIAATVSSATFKQRLSEFETKGYLVVAVSLKNADSKTHPYNTFDWKVQTPTGQVLDPTFGADQSLGSGDLVAGGSTSGTIVFELGAAKGNFYVIYKPGMFDKARGIWQATV